MFKKPKLVDNVRQKIYAEDVLADKIARCIFVGSLKGIINFAKHFQNFIDDAMI